MAASEAGSGSRKVVLGPRQAWPPIVFEDPELGCVVRIDAWMQRKRVPGKKWTLHAFGVQLGYLELDEAPEGDFQAVLRYDREHFPVEVHKFWISPDPIPVKEWEGKDVGEVLRLCLQDVRENYRVYIQHMREAKRKQKQKQKQKRRERKGGATR